jgi:hypothetical protein
VIFFIVLGAHDVLAKRYPRLARFYLTAFCSILFILSLTSIKLEERTFWAANRGKIAKHLVDQIKQTYPTLPKGAIVYFKNDPDYPFIAEAWGNSSTQAYYALSGKDAVQFFYQDQTIKVYYEDIGKPPSGETVFPIVAKISQK